MFGIGRRRTQGQLARAELNRSVGHLVRAATYASRGVGQTVTPRVRAAAVAVAPTAMLLRNRAVGGWLSTAAVLAPLALAARAGAVQAGVMIRRANPKTTRMRRQKRRIRRGGVMTGLVAAGTVAGVAGAVAVRRRRDQREWAEFDPTRTLEPMRSDTETLEVRTPTTGAESTRDVSGRPANDVDRAMGNTATGGAGRS